MTGSPKEEKIVKVCNVVAFAFLTVGFVYGVYVLWPTDTNNQYRIVTSACRTNTMERLYGPVWRDLLGEEIPHSVVKEVWDTCTERYQTLFDDAGNPR